MNREETKNIVATIFKAYRSQAQRMSDDAKRAYLDEMSQMFASTAYKDVDEAVRVYMRKGMPNMPNPADIANGLSVVERKDTTEDDMLFNKMMRVADMIANNKERISIIDPGGFRWSDEEQRKVYYHAETVITTTKYTQYDFAQLPEEIQLYAEDIDGLRSIHREIANNIAMARKRFVQSLPDIRAEIKSKRKSIEEWRNA
jgi:hypothetical protein